MSPALFSAWSENKDDGEFTQKHLLCNPWISSVTWFQLDLLYVKTGGEHVSHPIRYSFYTRTYKRDICE